MECSQTCKCCQLHNQRTASLHRHALDEINYYRRLLQMSPVSCIDGFSEDQASHTASSSSTSSAVTTLESMPVEILDRITAFTDGETVWQLSHAVRYYKYISSAMFNVMQCERRPSHPDRLWPAFMWFDTGVGLMAPPDTSVFPVSHLHTVGTYSRILSKHGGYAEVETWEDMETLFGAMPEMLDVRFGARSEGLAKLLAKISESKRGIYTLSYFFQHRDNHMQEIANHLATVPINKIAGDLNAIRFEGPFKTHEQVDLFMENLKGSRVWKVEVVKPWYGEATDEENGSFKFISDQFYERGWCTQNESPYGSRFTFSKSMKTG
ncbi:hypothetical protein HDU77_006534 [Chytriomyces hyalinus]|nr:hypothetical protein HDU77_006534 [Chytriomyces hyalinus]